MIAMNISEGETQSQERGSTQHPSVLSIQWCLLLAPLQTWISHCPGVCSTRQCSQRYMAPSCPLPLPGTKFKLLGGCTENLFLSKNLLYPIGCLEWEFIWAQAAVIHTGRPSVLCPNKTCCKGTLKARVSCSVIDVTRNQLSFRDDAGKQKKSSATMFWAVNL